jgi:hypothetical protein
MRAADDSDSRIAPPYICEAMSKRPSKRIAAEWRIIRLKKTPAALIGYIDAPDREQRSRCRGFDLDLLPPRYSISEASGVRSRSQAVLSPERPAARGFFYPPHAGGVGCSKKPRPGVRPTGASVAIINGTGWPVPLRL